MGNASAGFLVLVAMVWALQPKAGDFHFANIQDHFRLVGHLLGWLPAARELRPGTISPPNPRPTNGSIEEVQGFVDVATFRQQYLGKGPMVFRKGATTEYGFDLGCLTQHNRSVQELLAEHLGDREIRTFKDQFDDASAEFMPIQMYNQLAAEAASDPTKPIPYARAFPQEHLGSCRPLSTSVLMKYRRNLAVGIIPDDMAFVFYSSNNGTTTKMHMDVSDSFFVQVYGRKRWYFVDPQYATQIKVFADPLNLVFVAGFDIHREAIPPEIPVREVVLSPGDLLYFPAMTLHAVVNLDPVTVGVDAPVVDPYGAILRHRTLTLATLLNPWVAYKSILQVVQKGRFRAQELYFAEYMKGSDKYKS